MGTSGLSEKTKAKIVSAIRIRAQGAPWNDVQEAVGVEHGSTLSHRATAAISRHWQYQPPPLRYATCSTATLERHAREIWAEMADCG